MKVTLPYDPMWIAVEWAKTNCPNYITNAIHEDENGKKDYRRIDYFFSVDNEATLFALRWV